MKWGHTFAGLAAALAVSGCGLKTQDIRQQPELSPIGSARPVIASPGIAAQSHRESRARTETSTWTDGAADLFRDARAMRIGDVITVKISIKDKAAIDNSSNRSRESTTNLQGSTNFDVGIGGFARSGSATGQIGTDAKTDFKGAGGVTRSESIELLVAAVVREVLPNGNLIIQGTQEVRVNFELRELAVAGIVRPRDVATDNTISYERIAEARISYGGRGRITEVQQPGWGQQFMDMVTPF